MKIMRRLIDETLCKLYKGLESSGLKTSSVGKSLVMTSQFGSKDSMVKICVLLHKHERDKILTERHGAVGC